MVRAEGFSNGCVDLITISFSQDNAACSQILTAAVFQKTNAIFQRKRSAGWRVCGAGVPGAPKVGGSLGVLTATGDYSAQQLAGSRPRNAAGRAGGRGVHALEVLACRSGERGGSLAEGG